MNLDMSITFPEQSLSFIAAGGILMISAIIVIAFILVMRYAANLVPALLSVLLYLVVVYVGTELLTIVLSIIPGVNYLVLGSLAGYSISRAVIMAVMAYLTKWIVLKFNNRNNELSLGDSMMTGMGVGLGHVILAGIPMLAFYVTGTNMNTLGLETILQGLEGEELTVMYETAVSAASMPSIYYFLKGVNGTIDVIFEVAACIILYAVIRKDLAAVWSGIVIALSSVLNAVTMLGDNGVSNQYVLFTVIKAVVIVFVVMFVLRIDKENLQGELSSFSKLKTGKAMPKFKNLKNK